MTDRTDTRITPDEWQRHVFTLMGHAALLYVSGQREMPAYLYELAEKIAKTHVDQHAAERVRQVAAQQRAHYGGPKE